MNKFLNAPDEAMTDAAFKQSLAKDALDAFDVKWKKPPTVAELKADYQAALSIHQSHVATINGYLDSLDGKLPAGVSVKQGYSKIQPRLIRKQAEWRYAALSEPFLSSNNIFDAQPVTWEDKKAAEQNTLVLNHQFNNRIDKVAFIDEYVRTAVDEGTVICKVGWKYEQKIKLVDEPVYTMVPVEDPAQAQAMLQQGVPPYQQVQTGTRVVKKTVTTANHPTVEICEFENTLIDPTCKGDLDKAKFVIHSYPVSLDTLKSDKRYKNLDQVTFQDNNPLNYPDYNDRDNGNQFTFTDNARKKVMMFEYWGFRDVEGKGELTPILACYIGSTLVRLEENPYPDGKLPFVKVQYLPVRKSIYGEPDGALLEDNQKVIGAVTRGMLDLMGRSANAQQGIRKDALDVVNRRRFENGLDYQINANVNPDQAVYMHRYPEIPQSAMLMIQHQNNEAESLTGVKAYHSGIGGQSLGSTATGVRGALDAASKRELGILRRLANGLIQIGRKFISMNAEFLEETEIVRITNEEFVPVRRDDLDGSIDLRLTISTAEADNEKAQELSFMLQTLGNSVPTEITMMIMSDIAKLRKMPELAHKLATYQPQPDPMQQQMQQLQLQLLEAQVMNERAKGHENAVDAQVKLAKAEAEGAKARKYSSEADMLDLNFVKQGSGQSHNEAKDLQNQASLSRIDENAAAALLKHESDKALQSRS